MTVHRIDRVVFDLALDREERARPLQQRISQFCRDRLSRVLEHGLSSIDAGGAGVVVERMELDLGVLPASAGDAELEQRLARALADRLRQLRIDGLLSAAPDGALWRVHALFEDGRSGLGADSADSIVGAALRADPAALAAALRAWGVRQRCRVQLAQALSAPLRAQLVLLLAGAEGVFINSYADELALMHRRRPLVQGNGEAFDAAVWELVMAYLLVERGSRFNTRSFVASHVRRLAGRYRIGYADLLQRLTACMAVPQLAHAPRHGLAALLAGLAQDAHAPDAAGSSAAAQDGAAEARLLRALGTFLDYGAWPAPMAAIASVGDVLARLRQNDPDQLRALLRRHGGSDNARQRLLAGLTQPQREHLVQLLAPAEGGRIIAHISAIARIERRQGLAPAAVRPAVPLVWQLALSHLLNERGSVFNTRSFIGALLRKLAARHGLRYDTLLLGLIAHAGPAGRKGGSGLADILLALAEPALLGDPPASRPVPRADGVHGGQLRAFMRATRLASARLGMGSAADFASRLADALQAAVRGDPPPALAELFDRVLRVLALRYGRPYRQLLHASIDAAERGSQLRTELLGLYRRQASRPRAEGSPDPQAALELTLHYLRTGKLPAIAGPGNDALVLRQLNDANIFDHMNALPARLRAMPDKRAVARRLVRHLPLPQLRKILGMLAPAYAGLVESLLLAVAGLRVPGLLMGQVDLLARHWECVLAVLLGSDRWHDRGLLDNIGQEVARRLGLPPADYFAAVHAAAARLARAQERFEPLRDLLGQLRARAPASAAPAAAGAPNPTHGPACVALECLLRFGGPSANILDTAVREDRAAARRIVIAAVANPLERGRLASLLTPDQLERILPPVTAGARPSPPLRTRRQAGIDHGRLLARALQTARRDGAPAALAGALARELRQYGQQGLLRDHRPAPQAPGRVNAILPIPLPELPEGIEFHVPDAGLILLWQFLYQYFAALGMLHGRDFGSEAQRSRAVYLLQYLASGHIEAPEHDLLLNKFMCGWDLAAPLQPCAPLSEAERHWSGQLLTTVTQHWSVLKNTDHQLLRSTFLMRDARLSCVNERWTLNVAPGPYDMLLQTLPWPRSTIRCSWMKDMLWVDWP